MNETKKITNGSLYKLFKIVFMLAVLTLVFGTGALAGQATFKPQVITDYKENTVYRDVERIVYKPVEKVTQIEKVIYEPVETIVTQRVETFKPLRDFNSMEEFEQWLKNTGVIGVYFGVVDSGTGQDIEEFDCDNYARLLQSKAMKEGYIISFEVIRAAEYNNLFKQKQLPDYAIHAINSVILGNEVYYVEPQTHEIAFVANLD